MNGPMVFTHGGRIGGRAWFATSDSRNPRVHDNEMNLRMSDEVPTRRL
jgi:hypothetical protein